MPKLAAEKCVRSSRRPAYKMGSDELLLLTMTSPTERWSGQLEQLQQNSVKARAYWSSLWALYADSAPVPESAKLCAHRPCASRLSAAHSGTSEFGKGARPEATG